MRYDYYRSSPKHNLGKGDLAGLKHLYPDPSSYTVKSGEHIQPYIDRANNGDIITIASGIFQENLVIKGKSLTLIGAGDSNQYNTVVDGMLSGSVFSIDQTVYLRNIRITDGFSEDGGGIYNLGKLTVEDCTIDGNRARLSGNGIYNKGILTVNGGDIIDNPDDYWLSELAAVEGGGIFNEGMVTLNRGSIRGNHADYGGGIYNERTGIVTMNGACVDGNKAAIHGGGINNKGTVTMNGGSIDLNRAGFDGGGIISFGTVTIIGGSIASNNAEFNGGGILSRDRVTLHLNGGSITKNRRDNIFYYDTGTSTGTDATDIDTDTDTDIDTDDRYRHRHRHGHRHKWERSVILTA